jgi:hypothetical protein
MRETTRRFLLDLIERAGKTFIQTYLATWILLAGIGDDVGAGGSGAYDTLFTLNNVKAGVVGVALSFATSFGSRSVGRRDSASIVDEVAA